MELIDLHARANHDLSNGSGSEFDLGSVPRIVSRTGTRKRVEKWKRGFHLIASGAQAPMVCAYIDYARKVVGTGPGIPPGGDYAGDLATIQAFYRTITPKRPENFSAAR